MMEFEMSELAQEVAEKIDLELADCKADALNGILSDQMYRVFVNTVIRTLDGWIPRLNYKTRSEILEWVQEEYGVCL